MEDPIRVLDLPPSALDSLVKDDVFFNLNFKKVLRVLELIWKIWKDSDQQKSVVHFHFPFPRELSELFTQEANQEKFEEIFYDTQDYALIGSNVWVKLGNSKVFSVKRFQQKNESYNGLEYVETFHDSLDAACRALNLKKEDLVERVRFCVTRYRLELSPQVSLMLDVAKFDEDFYYSVGIAEVWGTLDNQLQDVKVLLEAVQIFDPVLSKVAEYLAWEEPELYEDLKKKGVIPTLPYISDFGVNQFATLEEALRTPRPIPTKPDEEPEIRSLLYALNLEDEKARKDHEKLACLGGVSLLQHLQEYYEYRMKVIPECLRS